MPVGLKLCDLTSAGTHILKSLRWDEILLPEVWPSNQIRVYVDSLICDLWLGRGSLIFYHSWKKKKKKLSVPGDSGVGREEQGLYMGTHRVPVSKMSISQ